MQQPAAANAEIDLRGETPAAAKAASVGWLHDIGVIALRVAVALVAICGLVVLVAAYSS